MKKAISNKTLIFQYFAIAFILLYQSQFLYGQRNLRYKDVYKTVTEKEKEEVYSLLLVYQKQDPYFANSYFQLGLISQYWSKDYDALTNLRDVEFFIYNTGLYFGLASSKIDAKEIRKNDKFYLNIERFKGLEKIEAEEVKTFIDERIAANAEYKKNVYIVTDLFNASIIHYNRCINIFKDINTKNNKIKDIYLTAGPEFSNQINELESSFDSTIYYLQNYQTAIKNYPIKEYNQKYKLLPIETYRLHGLTGSDFLQDEIPIWDYATWVKDVKKVLNSDISNIRQEINKADNLLNLNTNLLLETRDFKEDFELKNIDVRLKFKIGKFDHKSMLLHLFNYKESKIDFLSSTKRPINDINDTILTFLPAQKARYYENLVSKKQHCDSLNENIIKNVNPYDLNKYNEFFTIKYGGEAGLKNYSRNESNLLNKKLNESLENFKEYLIKETIVDQIYDSIEYKSKTVKLRHSEPDFENATQGNYYTVTYQKGKSRDYYITGYTVLKNNKIQPFIAKTNRLSEIKWFKIISTTKGNSTGTKIIIKEKGCEVLVNALEGAHITNQVFVFDDIGKQKDKFNLKLTGYPRYFNYDEINQEYLIVIKGNKTNPFDCLSDELDIAKLNANNKALIWQTSLNLKGQFVDIVKMNQELYAFSNFTEYSTDSTTILSKAGTSPNATNILITIIDDKGSVINERAILGRKAFFAIKAIKISSNAINLLGFKNELVNPSKIGKNELGDFLYMLLNIKGETYFDNW